jgi:hypothetical protein
MIFVLRRHNTSRSKAIRTRLDALSPRQLDSFPGDDGGRTSSVLPGFAKAHTGLWS